MTWYNAYVGVNDRGELDISNSRVFDFYADDELSECLDYTSNET